MGSWGMGSFDNDGAIDWTYGLEDVEDLGYVEAALDQVLRHPQGEAIPEELAENAVAAGEVLARLKGAWGEESAYTETVDRWVRAHPHLPWATVVPKALAALERIVVQPSDLLSCWEESGGGEEWIEAVRELRGRLGP